MSPIRFIMLGGFLGAGKTTSIARLARTYQERGLKVGIVTNDQATDLVDTQLLRAQGFRVGEVAGACFCCNFDELTSTAGKLESDQRPDIILAEPVGSCTDLVATVVLPLAQLFSAKFEVAPYGVLFKPGHGKRILSDDNSGGFSPQAEYIFRKQLEEADFVMINRCDTLSDEDIAELTSLVQASVDGIEVIPVSAKTGAGFDRVVELLDSKDAPRRNTLDIDYDVYAEGEADLGWLNMSLSLAAESEFQLDDFLLGTVEHLRQSLADTGAETAHLKVIGISDGQTGVANLIERESPAELSLPSKCATKTADVVVNARVAIDPETLTTLVKQAVASAADACQTTPTIRKTQSFRPGRPVPTHRMS